ncbi:MAG TPA: SusC/RagA family TonB-linked outer membrane protein, partial [Phnomibacter sp.]|nr:SusC/RagA family TonB-linked outer membrane protein [Phnomibacter sp.]
SLTGKVVNAMGDQAIISATVKLKGAAEASVTDETGRFSLTVPTGNIVLEVSSIGFSPREVSVGADENDITITLSEGKAELDEVVVTALGIKRQRKSLGYAVQELKGSELVQARETNLANSLSGKVAGLQVVRSSNGAGGSSKIVLRGNNSLTGTNQPLIVVDGVPIDNFTGTSENGYWGAGFDRGNGLGDISAEDIESMSVLKGPSAAALYGNRAGNGVILITTKSGRKQQGLGITVSSTFGFENIFTNPELQNTFGQGLNGTYDNRAGTSWGPKAEGQSLPNWQNVNEPLRIHDNLDNFLRTGTTQNHSVSFQQQFGTTSIYSSFSRLEDQSILPANKLTRTNLTARAVTRFGANNRWTSDTKIQYNNTSGYNRPINGRDNSSVYVLNMLPRSLDITSFSNATDNDGNMLWYGGSNQVNPYWRALYDQNQDSRDRFIMNGSVKYAFTDWLDAEVKAGADMYTTNTSRKIYAGSPQPRTGRYEMGKEVFTETNYTSMIHARKDNVIGRFGANATIGGNLMAQKYSSLRANSGELVVPNLFSLNNGVNNPTVGEGLGERRINSLFGTVGINYDGYIYLDATFRNDWSSTLSKTNRSFFYPSFSLSYVLTEMLNSMGKDIPSWLSYAKLRGSYAEVGNDLPPYQLYNVYRIGKDPNGNTTASRDNILRDPNVRSELIKSMEFGAELRFMKNRVGLDFSWYKSNATRQLLDIPLDPMSGYSAMKINAGDIQNEGFEIMFDARVLNDPRSVNWTVVANYSQNRNTIVELASDLGVTEYTLGGFDDLFIRAVKGSMYGDIYGTRFRRIEDQASPFFGQLLLNGDGLPVRDPRIVKLGNQQARGMFGITNNLNYKGFGLSFLIDARLGGEIFSASQVGLRSSGNAAITAPGGARPDLVVDGVILDGSGNPVKNNKAVSQQLYWLAVSTANNLGVGEAFVYDATNIRLRNVQLSYDLPRSFIGRTPLQNARITASCNNVWMIKSYMDGIDPESVFATGTNAVGFENGAPPTMRSFLFSLTLGF